MRKSTKRSVHRYFFLRAVVVMLLMGATVAAVFGFKAAGQQPNQPANQPAPPPRPAITMASPEDAAREMNNPRSKWFREVKYGLFIHWGLYAIPAGTWKGQQIPGIGEWIMNRAKIPVKEYEQLAAQFNPVKFNAEEWAQLAQDAGMKYLTITSKHHDIHLFTWTKEFSLDGVKGKVTKASLLADPKKALKFTQTGGKLVVQLPDKAPGELATVLRLEVTSMD